jgi:hypothetical protein
MRRNRWVRDWEMTRAGTDVRNRCVLDWEKLGKGTDVKGNERCHEKEQVCM